MRRRFLFDIEADFDENSVEGSAEAEQRLKETIQAALNSIGCIGHMVRLKSKIVKRGTTRRGEGV